MRPKVRDKFKADKVLKEQAYVMKINTQRKLKIKKKEFRTNRSKKRKSN